MFCTRAITQDLTWVGGNDRRLAMFEGVYSVPNGVSYNSYLLNDASTVLFDTVDKAVARVFFENLAHALNEYYPMNIDEDLAGLFGLETGTAIMASRQTFFDVGDTPIIFNYHYFSPNIYRVKTLQNWALSD